MNVNAVLVEANDEDVVVVAAAAGAAAGADVGGCEKVAELVADRNNADVVGADADERSAIILDLAWWSLDQLTARPEQM